MNIKLPYISKIGLLFLIISAVAGCAITPPAAEFIPINKGKKIAILVDANKYPHHTHLSVSEILSKGFTKRYEYDWKIEELIIQALRDEIEPNTSFEVVSLRSLGLNQSKNANFIHSQKGAWAHQADKTEQIKKLQEQGVNIILNISEVRSVVSEYCNFYNKDICHHQYSEGYGLVSESSLLGNKFYASASFDTQIETLNPPSNLTKHGKFYGINFDNNLNTELNYLGDPKYLKEVTEEELEPVKRRIVKHFSIIGKKLAIYLKEKAA